MNSFRSYRQLPDQRVKAAEFRWFRVLGKATLAILCAILIPMIYGFNQAHDFAFWWLFSVPALLTLSLFWGSFPAFCRCPHCRKRMARRIVEGKVTTENKYFSEIAPKRHFLVCDECQISLFLTESYNGD